MGWSIVLPHSSLATALSLRRGHVSRTPLVIHLLMVATVFNSSKWNFLHMFPVKISIHAISVWGPSQWFKCYAHCLSFLHIHKYCLCFKHLPPFSSHLVETCYIWSIWRVAIFVEGLVLRYVRSIQRKLVSQTTSTVFKSKEWFILWFISFPTTQQGRGGGGILLTLSECSSLVD